MFFSFILHANPCSLPSSSATPPLPILLPTHSSERIHSLMELKSFPGQGVGINYQGSHTHRKLTPFSASLWWWEPWLVKNNRGKTCKIRWLQWAPELFTYWHWCSFWEKLYLSWPRYPWPEDSHQKLTWESNSWFLCLNASGNKRWSCLWGYAEAKTHFPKGNYGKMRNWWKAKK